MKFTELSVEKTPIALLQPTIENNNKHYRLYSLPYESGKGFKAIAVSFTSCESSIEDYWVDPTLEVDILFEVTAYFDGVRHLEFNRGYEEGMDGYIYYPDMKYLNELLKKVEELEQEYCNVDL